MLLDASFFLNHKHFYKYYLEHDQLELKVKFRYYEVLFGATRILIYSLLDPKRLPSKKVSRMHKFLKDSDIRQHKSKLEINGVMKAYPQ